MDHGEGGAGFDSVDVVPAETREAGWYLTAGSVAAGLVALWALYTLVPA